MSNLHKQDRDALNRIQQNRPAYVKMFDGKYALADCRPEVQAFKQFENLYGIEFSVPFVAHCLEDIFWFESLSQIENYLEAWNEHKAITPGLKDFPDLYIVEVKSLFVNVPKKYEGKDKHPL